MSQVQQPGPGSAKTCVLCGEDCAGQPRTKDSHGRYYHQSCHQQAIEQKRTTPRTTSRTTSRTAPPTAPRQAAPPVAAPHNGDDFHNDALADLLEQVEPASPVQTTRPCPACGQPVEHNAVICISCGSDLAEGKALKTVIKGSKPERPRPSLNFNATYIIYAIVGVVFALGLIGLASEAAAGAYFVAAWLVAFAYGIMVIVDAFKTSILQGVLTLVVPLWGLLYILFISERSSLRWGLLLYLVGIGLAIALALQHGDFSTIPSGAAMPDPYGR